MKASQEFLIQLRKYWIAQGHKNVPSPACQCGFGFCVLHNSKYWEAIIFLMRLTFYCRLEKLARWLERKFNAARD